MPRIFRIAPWFLAPLLIAGVTACSAGGAPPQPVRVDLPRERAAPGSTFAVTRSLEVEVPAQALPGLVDRLVAQCRADTADACELLNSDQSTRPELVANLRLRAAPAGVAALVRTAAEAGTVTGQSTSAEDLAAPVADNARKLVQLKDYAARLRALQAATTHDVEAAIRLQKELSEVETSLEDAAGTEAQLRRRIDTQLLNLHLESVRHAGLAAPIGRAVDRFTENLSEGVAGLISAAAFLGPAIVVIGAVTWAVLRWRRRRRGVKA